jgi:crotonobetainyl-CoA:carnitine CoA-transferase CaiB-like acyl-CoA transferase
VPAGPVRGVGEALRAMEDAHDGDWLQTAGAMRLAPDPIRLDGEHLPLRGAPPTTGQHTTEVLSQLGLTADEISALKRDGIVT